MLTDNRTIVLELDEDDYASVQQAIVLRQTWRDHHGPILPDSESNTAGAYLAEICRGWLERLEAARAD